MPDCVLNRRTIELQFWIGLGVEQISALDGTGISSLDALVDFQQNPHLYFYNFKFILTIEHRSEKESSDVL